MVFEIFPWVSEMRVIIEVNLSEVFCMSCHVLFQHKTDLLDRVYFFIPKEECRKIQMQFLFLLRMHINYCSWACKSSFYGATITKSNIKTVDLLVLLHASFKHRVECLLYASLCARCRVENSLQERTHAFKELIV